MRSEFTERVYAAARQIPPGRVASYGCLAALAGNPRAARIVGYVMHTCPAQAHVPCHRVVNRDGRLCPCLLYTSTTGRAHLKHTEGGDFRQATYRAVRQGLMQAESILLEPWYAFRLEIPSEQMGRALADVQRMGGTFDPPQTLDTCTCLLYTSRCV